jgi:archaellum biogenesis protein FlaJ (TadC family)
MAYGTSKGVYLAGRRLFQTYAGTIDLGQEAMREGDLIVTVKNSIVSLVLRTQENLHRFVGLAALLQDEWLAAHDKALEDKTQIKDIEIR